jgi:hypothetical protein
MVRGHRVRLGPEMVPVLLGGGRFRAEPNSGRAQPMGARVWGGGSSGVFHLCSLPTKWHFLSTRAIIAQGWGWSGRWAGQPVNSVYPVRLRQ